MKLVSGNTSTLLFSRLLVVAEFTYQDPAVFPTDFPSFTVDARFKGQSRNIMSSVSLALLFPLACSGSTDSATVHIVEPVKDKKVKIQFHVPLFPASYTGSTNDNITAKWTAPTGWAVEVYGIDPIVDQSEQQPCFIQYSTSTLTAGTNPVTGTRFTVTRSGIEQIQQKMFPLPVTSSPEEVYWQGLAWGAFPLNSNCNDYTLLASFFPVLYLEGGVGGGAIINNPTTSVTVLQSEKIPY